MKKYFIHAVLFIGVLLSGCYDDNTISNDSYLHDSSNKDLAIEAFDQQQLSNNAPVSSTDRCSSFFPILESNMDLDRFTRVIYRRNISIRYLSDFQIIIL